jgi:hypothetical protein
MYESCRKIGPAKATGVIPDCGIDPGHLSVKQSVTSELRIGTEDALNARCNRIQADPPLGRLRFPDFRLKGILGSRVSRNVARLLPAKSDPII